MNKFLATVKVSGVILKTIVFADSSSHAKQIAQAQFGINSVVALPTKIN